MTSENLAFDDYTFIVCNMSVIGPDWALSYIQIFFSTCLIMGLLVVSELKINK